MNRILLLLFFLYPYIFFSQSQHINEITVKLSEIHSKFNSLKTLECQTSQSKLLYKKPEIYSFILGKTVRKKFQSFEYEEKKGSILYFEFTKSTNGSKNFIEGLLWHGKKASKSHPEKIITKNKTMIIVSFPFKSTMGKDLTEIINQKL